MCNGWQTQLQFVPYQARKFQQKSFAVSAFFGWVSGLLPASEPGSGKMVATQHYHQDIGESRQPQAEMSGPRLMASSSIREKHQLLFLETILHVTAYYVQLVV